MPGLYACGEMLGSLCAAIAAREADADVCLLGPPRRSRWGGSGTSGPPDRGIARVAGIVRAAWMAGHP